MSANERRENIAPIQSLPKNVVHINGLRPQASNRQLLHPDGTPVKHHIKGTQPKISYAEPVTKPVVEHEGPISEMYEDPSDLLSNAGSLGMRSLRYEIIAMSTGLPAAQPLHGSGKPKDAVMHDHTEARKKAFQLGQTREPKFIDSRVNHPAFQSMPGENPDPSIPVSLQSSVQRLRESGFNEVSKKLPNGTPAIPNPTGVYPHPERLHPKTDFVRRHSTLAPGAEMIAKKMVDAGEKIGEVFDAAKEKLHHNSKK